MKTRFHGLWSVSARSLQGIWPRARRTNRIDYQAFRLPPQGVFLRDSAAEILTKPSPAPTAGSHLSPAAILTFPWARNFSPVGAQDFLASTFSRKLRVLGLSGEGEERERQVAIAVGVLVQVVLMVVLRRIVVAQRLLLHNKGLRPALLLLLPDLLDERQIGGIGEVDARAVARALVVALTVEARGVDGLEEHAQEEAQADARGVVDDAHRLGEACGVGVDLLVGGMLGVAVGEARLGVGDALYLLEEVLCAPEAPAGEINLFHRK